MSAAGNGPAASNDGEGSSARLLALELSVRLAAVGHSRVARVVLAAGEVAEQLGDGFTVDATSHVGAQLIEAVVDHVQEVLRLGFAFGPPGRIGNIERAAARVAEDLDNGFSLHAGDERARELLRAFGRGDS